MNQFRRSRFAKWVSRLLAPAMVVPLLTYFVPPARAAGVPGAEAVQIPAIIVLDFNNLSGFGGAVVGRSAATAVAQEMQASDRWDVLSSSVVNAAMTSQGLTPPLDVPGMVQLGRAAEADSVIFGQVYGIDIKENPMQAQVGLRVEMRDVASGELINGAVETATSGIRPGYTGDPQVLVDEALRKAAFQVREAMTRNRLPKGTVLNTQVTGSGTREILINIGSQSGVVEGMQMIVTRQNTRVSRIRVSRVEADQSTAVVVESTRGAQPEDSVQAIFSLTPVEQLVNESKTTLSSRGARPKSGSKSFGKALGAVLGAAILVFALSGGTKSGRLSGSAGGRPAAEATHLNNGAPVAAAPAVKVSWEVPNMVRVFDILEFQIYRSDVLGGTTTGGTTGGTTIPPNTPVGVAAPGQNFFYDTTDVRDVTFLQVPAGSTPTGGNTTEPTETTVTGIPGLVPARPVTYRVVMVYRRQQTSTSTTDSGSGTGGSTGGTGTTQFLYLQTPVVNTGQVTPIEAPVASSPQAGTVVNATSVTFDLQGVTGANQYMIEISKDPNFSSSGVKQIVLPLQTASQQSSSVTQTVNVSNLFPNQTGTFYWHAGARSRLDNPGPDPGIYNKAPGDRRWVYSDLESFIIQ